MKEQIKGKKNAEELNSKHGSNDETAKHESKGEKVKPSMQGAHSKMHSESGVQTDSDSPLRLAQEREASWTWPRPWWSSRHDARRKGKRF